VLQESASHGVRTWDDPPGLLLPNKLSSMPGREPLLGGGRGELGQQGAGGVSARSQTHRADGATFSAALDATDPGLDVSRGGACKCAGQVRQSGFRAGLLTRPVECRLAAAAQPVAAAAGLAPQLTCPVTCHTRVWTTATAACAATGQHSPLLVGALLTRGGHRCDMHRPRRGCTAAQDAAPGSLPV
jgi:hypothetical protein